MEGSILVHELRKVISLVDLLRDIGLDKQLSLPKIVVVGNQSSGKSSLLQQIVGLDFLPRGSGVVTRRPLQLRLNRRENLKHPYGEFQQIVEGGIKKKYMNFSQVKAKIEELTEKVCGHHKIIKDVPIVLNIFSSTCPNLTIIDLPGITSIPVGEQPKNIYEITKNMVIRYAKDKRSIILCVIPANQDLSTSEALKLVRQIDPQGQRSIGCLTKIDIMNRGDDAMEILKNKEIPLRYGYVGVKNRSQQDIMNKISVAQSLKAERIFFTKSPIYSTLPSDTFSTESLTKKLTKILYQQIKETLPLIVLEIRQKKSQAEETLKQMGEGVSIFDDDLMMGYGWKSASSFLEILKNSLQGIKGPHYKGNPISFEIREQLNIIYKEQFYQPATAQLSDKEIEKAMINFPGDSTIPGFPSIDAFLALLNPLLKKLQNPAFALNNRVHQIIEHESMKIISQIMTQKFPSFNEKFVQIVKKTLEKYRRQLQSYLNLLLDSQLNYLYTNDSLYLLGDFGITEKQRKKLNSGKIKDPLIFQLRKRIDSYFKLVVRNLRDMVPKQIFNFLISKSLKQLQFQVFQFISDTKKLKDLLKQPEQIRNKRSQCIKAIKIFQDSQKKIRLDPQISKLFSLSDRKLKYYKKMGIKTPEQQSEGFFMILQTKKQQKKKSYESPKKMKKPSVSITQRQQVQTPQKIQIEKKNSPSTHSNPSSTQQNHQHKPSTASIFSMFGTNISTEGDGKTLQEQVQPHQKKVTNVVSPNKKPQRHNFTDIWGQPEMVKRPEQKGTQNIHLKEVKGHQQKKEEKKKPSATFNNLFGIK